MSVTVTTTTGTQQVDAGADWNVQEGILFVVDGQGNSLAAFADGIWQSAVVVQP